MQEVGAFFANARRVDANWQGGERKLIVGLLYSIQQSIKQSFEVAIESTSRPTGKNETKQLGSARKKSKLKIDSVQLFTTKFRGLWRKTRRP